MDKVSGGPALGNVVAGDDVTFTKTEITYAFADDAVGADKTVTATVSGLALRGADAANYIQPANTFTVKGNVIQPSTGGEDADEPAPAPAGGREIPQTGDPSHIALWIGLMMTALAGFGACAVMRRKDKQMK